MVTLPEIKAKSIRESVAETLRQAFLAGYFSPGQNISEMDLASQLKVSRGPIRDALLMLSQEGLLSYSLNRGFTVIELTDRDFEEINIVRIPLEALALTLAKDSVSDADMEVLDGLKQKLIEAYQADDFGGATRWDLQFHSTLWGLCGNIWLKQALNRIMVPNFTFTMIYRRKPVALTSEKLEMQHQMYLDYLKGRCEQAAEECVRIHLLSE